MNLKPVKYYKKEVIIIEDKLLMPSNKLCSKTRILQARAVIEIYLAKGIKKNCRPLRFELLTLNQST